jgi:hypothetical protein
MNQPANPLTLTSANVEAIFLDCLFKPEEDTSNHVVGEGVMQNFGFHPVRLESHKDEIKTLLHQLNDAFLVSKGGGWSFLQACVTKDGKHWGEHMNVEQLMALGIATNQAKLLMPRELWNIMPGGMPYFSVMD